jgi:carbonic anhydrase
VSENDGIAKVFEGYLRFTEEVYPEHRKLFDQLKNQQNPQVLFITCADSRIDPTLITHTDPGDLFVSRNIGNIVPAYGEMMGGVSAVVEYAVMALSVKDIIVCGHTDCGAMKALRDPDAPSLAAMPTVKSWLRNAHAALSAARAKQPQAKGEELTHLLVEENVLLQLQHLRTHPSVAAGLAAGRLRLYGCVYNIGNGEMDVFDEAAQRFVPIQSVLAAAANADPGNLAEHPGVPPPLQPAKAG